MFEIPVKQQVKLIKASTPMENHGKDFKLAVVLTVEAAISSQSLRQFDPALCDSLYREADQEDTADLVTEPTGPTVRRFPKMSAFDWEYEGTGYELMVDYGIGGESNIKLIDAKVNGVTITPLEGGTSTVKFNVVVHPEALDVGRLCEMQKRNIDITLTAPAPETVAQLFGDTAQAPAAAPDPAKQSKDQKTAEAMAEAQRAFEATGEQAGDDKLAA